MKNKIISLNHFDSLAADTSRNTAAVASATSEAIRELANQVAVTSGGITIVVSDSEPNDSNVYWLCIEDSEGGDLP